VKKATSTKKRDLTWKHFEQRYMETKNPLFALAAIGRWRNNPPEWALEACQRFYEDELRMVRSTLEPKRRGTQPYEGDGRLLEQMADEMVEHDISAWRAALKVTNEPKGGPNSRRIWNHWKAERVSYEADEGAGPDVGHPRTERAFKRYFSKIGFKPRAPWDGDR